MLIVFMMFLRILKRSMLEILSVVFLVFQRMLRKVRKKKEEKTGNLGRFAVNRHVNLNHHIGMQGHADLAVADGLDWAIGHADLSFGHRKT